MEYAIKTENLTKYYGKSRGIVDVSLSVNEGEMFGFIGPNGAGKSTFIRTILALIYKTSGSAEIVLCDIYFNFDDYVNDFHHCRHCRVRFISEIYFGI